MAALIKDVLNYSSLANHKNDATFTDVDLNEILENVKTDFELEIEQKKAVINADGLPAIKGILFQINQLFSNLISNALKFSERSPVIMIVARSLSKEDASKYPELNSENNYVELTFTDNGIGFDQKHADQIFTIFHRLHGKDTFSGTGIGLSLCKKIVQNHNGIIQAEGVEKKGATFTIILPGN
ncbi:MAG: HAMP domain-containing sensor histidine kinase [Cyclobacteriaceae bacterium]